MTEPSAEVVIYTDGGAEPNPGTGGWAAILVQPGTGKRRELSGGEDDTTNNRMELTAAIRGLESLTRSCRVALYTDSKYLRNGVTRWLPGWIRQGWKRKDGELKNVDLWRRLAELQERHSIRWQWVKGHAGNELNERADQLASREIRARNPRAAVVAEARREGPPAEVEVLLKVTCVKDRGGWAARMRENGQERVLSGAYAPTTANQMDILAALAVLEKLPPQTRVDVHTGSDYLRNGASQWLSGWRRRGWRTAEGKEVKNADAWRRLDSAMGLRQVRWLPVADRKSPELKELGKVAKAALEGG